jgi:hypothetical protein
VRRPRLDVWTAVAAMILLGICALALYVLVRRMLDLS